jgi:hypothetical protein
MKRTLLATLAASALISGCGGGGGSTNTTTSASTPAIHSGQFVDAPTKGLIYTATPSGLSGITDDLGNFTFREGDTVSFKIATSNGDLPLGKLIPDIPSDSSNKSVVHVLSLSNGVAAAQILQSLGGTGPRVDVSKVSTLSQAEVDSFNEYLSSGGLTTKPSKVTVTEVAALGNAIGSVATLSSQNLKKTAGELLSGKTMVYSAINELQDLPTSPPSSTKLKIGEFGILYFDPAGTSKHLCVNSPWIDLANPSATYSDTPGSGNNCGGSGVVTYSGKWAQVSGAPNKITSTVYSDTIEATFLSLDERQGLWTGSIPTLPAPYINGAKGSGVYTILNSSFSISALAGKTFKIGGQPTCNNGFAVSSFNSSGTGYEVKCEFTRLDGQTNTPAQGVAKNDPMFPGLVQLSDSGDSFWIGVKNGSTIADGTVAIVYPGNENCGDPAFTNGPGGPRFSMENCGYARFYQIKQN